MQNERVKVLTMLDEGKITAEEAARLLDALKEPPREQNKNIKNNDDIGLDRFVNFFWSSLASVLPGKEETYITAVDIQSDKQSLDFEGKNAPIKISSYSGNQLKIEVKYRPRIGQNPNVFLKDDNGAFSLAYNSATALAVGMSVLVPDAANVGRVALKTSNAQITADDLHADVLEISTTNARISVNDVSATKISAQTQNAKITLDDVTADKLTAETSNAGVEIVDWDFASSTGERAINVKTSNSGVKISPVCEKTTCAFKLFARTTNGKIAENFRALKYAVDKPAHIEAQSEEYDGADSKLALSVKTSNGNITIR